MQGFSNFLGLFQVIVANPEIEKERKKEKMFCFSWLFISRVTTWWIEVREIHC